MGRSFAARVLDVRAVVEAAQRLQRDREGLVGAIVASTGLSPEGVRLGFEEHLETEPSPADLEALVRGAGGGDTPHVHVILSAGVFVGALRAIAVACAASATVTVRASRRDPVFAEALVQALGRPGVTLGDGAAEGGEIHVYGTDETAAKVAAGSPPAVTVKRHGTGLGVAIVSAADDTAVAAGAIARDVVPFDQRGCLSPRVVLVEGGEPRAQELARALDAELAAAEPRVPRGALSRSEREEAARYAETIAFAGQIWRGAAHLVGSSQGQLIVPPAGRHVHVRAVADASDARACLGPIARYVVALGVNARSLAGWGPERARVSALGLMQRPPLDGPVDLRP
jgi:hypothetical protein